MPWYRIPGGGRVHINLGRKGNANPPPACRSCGWISTLLCDWKTDEGTCDRAVCEDCAFEIDADKHLCPVHVAQYRAWLADQGIAQS